MERPFPIEDLVDRVGNRYAIVVAVAKRARQLKSGARPLVEIESKNPTTIALHEISAGLVTIHEAEQTEAETPAPSSPELDQAERLSQVLGELAGDDDDAVDEEQDVNFVLADLVPDDEAEVGVEDEHVLDDEEDLPDDEDDAEQ